MESESTIWLWLVCSLDPFLFALGSLARVFRAGVPSPIKELNRGDGRGITFARISGGVDSTSTSADAVDHGDARGDLVSFPDFRVERFFDRSSSGDALSGAFTFDGDSMADPNRGAVDASLDVVGDGDCDGVDPLCGDCVAPRGGVDYFVQWSCGGQ